MKKIFLIICLLVACWRWPGFAHAGYWLRCDDVGTSYRGEQPPHPHISFGANATAEQYANGGWCVVRVA